MKKKWMFNKGRHPYGLSRLIRVMKLTTFILLLTFITVNASVYSQVTKLDLKVQRVSVKEVLSRIEDQSQFFFMYNDRKIDVERRVDIDLKQAKIEDLLKTIFEGTNTKYLIKDRQIVLFNESDEEFRIPNTESTSQQQKSISGKVTDSTGASLPGASVVVKGTTTGVITDMDGKYSLTKVPQNAILQFSFVGMKTQEILVGEKTTINIELADETVGIDEVVAIGYGTVKKKDLTGAVSSVNTKSMGQIPTTSVLEAMSGLVAGVDVSMNGRPGETGFILIRGVGNLTNNTPLYIIDGLPTDNIRDINTNDIESVQVLKDASAAAIYGSRAANGVIIMTTKKGSTKEVKFDFSSNYGLQHFSKPFELAGAKEWADIDAIARQNAGLPVNNQNLSIDTDWWEAIIRKGITQEYNAALSGGTESGNYYISGEYYGNKGVLIGSSYERYSVRINTNAKRGILTVGQTLTASNGLVDPTVANTINDALAMAPVVPIYDSAKVGGFGIGNPASDNNMGNNPVAQEELQVTRNKNFSLRAAIWGELALLKSLKYKLNLGYELNFGNSKTLRKEGDWRMNMAYEPSYLFEDMSRLDKPLIENTITFDKKIGNHSLNAVIGHSFQKELYQQINGKNQKLLTTSDGKYFDVLDAGTNLPQTGGFRNEAAILSYFGRVNYSFGDKYILTATIRRDASSRVLKENRWGNFPSISAAWRIKKENFLENVTWIDDLKARISYGSLGSMNIGYWDYIPTINTFLTATFGTSQTQQNAATQTKLVNQDLVWETKKQLNYGIDAVFLKNRLSLTADYYISKTNDVLTEMPILMTTGNDGGNPVVNAASLQNKGIEISIGWRDTKKDFSYFTSLNFTASKNKVIDLGYGKTQIVNGTGRTAVGSPMGEFFLLRTDGLFQSDEQIQAYKSTQGKLIQPDAKPGDIKYLDINKDGLITDADRQVVGDPNSMFQIGLNSGLSWKNFDLKMNWFLDIGCDVFNATKQFIYGGMAADGNYVKGFNFWRPENRTNIPRPIAGKVNNYRDSDFWLENGSWAKLKTLSIGYSIPKKIVERINISNCRVSVSGQNLLTITKYTMGDPEFRKDNIWNKGYRGVGAYPNPVGISLGFQLQF